MEREDKATLGALMLSEKPEERTPSEAELAALARFRYVLRRFLAFSEQAALELGMTAQWYQALLVIKTVGAETPISVGELAVQLVIKDHSAAELVSRLVDAKLVRRKVDPQDRRRSLIVMTTVGDQNVLKLAAVHLARLREEQAAIMKVFGANAQDMG